MADNSKASSNRKWPLAVLFLVTLALLALVVWRLDVAPQTDDAYVYADTISVVSEVPGRIVTLAVRDNQAVKKGDLLFQVDPRPFADELAKANAALVALDKQIALTGRVIKAQEYNASSVHAAVERARVVAKQSADTLRRTEPLLPQGYVSADEVDRARSAQRAAQAELSAAQLLAQQAAAAVTGVDALVAQRDVVQADIALATLRLEMATVRAPFDGRVVALKTSVGQFASPLKPVFSLINAERWYVVGNFRESELKNVRPGTSAVLTVMTDSGRRFDGTVDSIGFGVLPDDGGLVLEGLPRVQRSLNWVRVAQRFPVKISVENPDPELFRLGASALASLRPQRQETPQKP